MKTRLLMLQVLLAVVLLAGCAGGSNQNQNDASTIDLPLVGKDGFSATVRESPVREITILYTNDEHGWMQGMEEGEGAENLMDIWRTEEGYSPDGPYLLLSGGDMWTGPAISTWFEGMSMVEVMNEMDYDAAAVGNHEFDFGLDALRQRASESAFPFLSANIRRAADGSYPENIGIIPYAIREVNEIKVGIIGLTSTSTSLTTNPVNVRDFKFMGYEAALRDVLPLVREEGAELIVVAAHACGDELALLAEQIGDLGVQLLGGGHCNELFAEEIGQIVVVEGGYHLTAYARVTFHFDTNTDTVVSAEYETRQNTGGTTDAAVAAIVDRWQDEVDAELEQVIGYTQLGIANRSQEMTDLVTESWLRAYPAADVAATNMGGFRAGIDVGDIMLSEIVGAMPFSNVLVEVHLSGQELLSLLARSNLAVGGVRFADVRWELKSTQEEIDRGATYSVLVNDFMYAGGDGYGFLAELDPDAYNTGIDWRQPVIDWILEQASTPENPIDESIRQLH